MFENPIFYLASGTDFFLSVENMQISWPASRIVDDNHILYTCIGINNFISEIKAKIVVMENIFKFLSKANLFW